jgi:DNA-binding NarL/FixJ family response regulator
MIKPVRLVIADDTELIRRAVSHVVADCCPGVEVVGEAKDYAELFRVTNDAKPHVVLMDLNMPSEIDLNPDQIRVELDSCCLLVMSAWFDEQTKARARNRGASELLDKSTLAETLRPAIERCVTRSKAAAQ